MVLEVYFQKGFMDNSEIRFRIRTIVLNWFSENGINSEEFFGSDDDFQDEVEVLVEALVFEYLEFVISLKLKNRSNLNG